jgi:hypothetical protein
MRFIKSESGAKAAFERFDDDVPRQAAALASTAALVLGGEQDGVAYVRV